MSSEESDNYASPIKKHVLVTPKFKKPNSMT